MKIATLIIVHPKLKFYLDKVEEQFSGWDKTVVVRGDFKEKPEYIMRNEALKDLQGYDFVFTIDADEFITKVDQKIMVDAMISRDRKVGLCGVLDFTKKYEAIWPARSHKPIVIVDPKAVIFYDARCANIIDSVMFKSVKLYHFGLCHPKGLKWKTANPLDKKHKQEMEDMLKMKTKKIIMPAEIKELLDRGDKNA